MNANEQRKRKQNNSARGSRISDEGEEKVREKVVSQLSSERE